MKTAYIGVGSNQGDKFRNCQKAVKRIDQIPDCRVENRSDWYLTAPVGVEGQAWYLNGVVSVSINLPPRDLLSHLLAIEKVMGRVRKERWESRIMDLDILLFGGDMIQEADLIVPHPRMHLRRFVLVPITQLAPDVMHPALGRTMKELLDGLKDEGQVVRPFEVT